MESKNPELKQIFSSPILELEEVKNLKASLKDGRGGLFALSGLIGSARALFIYATAFDIKKKLVILPSEQEAIKLMDEYKVFDRQCSYYPLKDILFYGADLRSNELTAARVRVIKSLAENEKNTVFTSIEAILGKLPPLDQFLKRGLELSPGASLDLDEVRTRLVAMGYEHSAIVTTPGQYCVRGGILDIFPLTESLPLRIELWDDEIDSIRWFDPDTQKSVNTTDYASVFPATELAIDDNTFNRGLKKIKEDATEGFKLPESSDMMTLEAYLPYFYSDTSLISDFFDEDSYIFFEDPKKLFEVAKDTYSGFVNGINGRMEAGISLPKQLLLMEEPKKLFEKLSEKRGIVFFNPAEGKSPLLIKDEFHINTSPAMSFNNSIPLLKKEIESLIERKFSVVICGSSRTRQKRLCEGLIEDGVECYYTEDLETPIGKGRVALTLSGITSSVIIEDAGVVFYSENDIFGGIYHRKRKKTYKKGEAIESFRELSVGDYVVHENYGLGTYKGIEKIKQDFVTKDFLKIEYAGKDNLYVPVSQLNVITKYSGAGDAKPKLSSLSSQEWKRTKESVKNAVGDMAKELVNLYALRQQKRGYEYGQDTEWQKEFEETFPYEETRGQIEAIEDVKSDLMSDKIMDRLICGDVGFGKTEIALRAAFKVVQENKQVVFLCPTTVLAQQHYNTFIKRMKDYPVKIGLLSRFRTKAQNEETVRMLKSGELDIVVGTHRALSADVGYKNLGLLVIDEEQRFGVRHKERIKQLKTEVDVLCLTATPIPRTLHMSLIGIRDMSILDEAPLERQPVQTFVFEQNYEIVREAIERELSRGGQVYYVVNRIKKIPEIAARVQELVPHANVAYAHGRMTETRIEDIMEDFVDKQIDVLVATTIIEIGLDISNVNTIIIHDADNLGLSQLYQLRGRVGRSSRTAYAFLMYSKDKVIKEVAEKRLTAIREFSGLGSGFKIAMRDLEIRGAGNLLGSEQHGHMEAVGYDLYCKLLSQAIQVEKGEEALMDFETAIDIMTDAYIPETYIPDEAQKLEIYRRIAFVCDDESEERIIDELIDRFGDPPKSIVKLIKIARLRDLAHKCFITKLQQDMDILKVILFPSAKINPAKIPEFVEKFGGKLKFEADVKAPAFIWKIPDYKQEKDIIPVLMSFCKDMFESLVENVA